MAYKCIMQSANVVLQANGFRTLTGTPGHHQYLDGMNRPLSFGSGVPLYEAFLRRWQ